MKAYSKIRTRRAASLEELECRIYELEGDFVKALHEVGTFAFQIPVVPQRPFKRSTCHYETNETVLDKLDDTPNDAPSQSSSVGKKKKSFTGETFLGATRNSALRRKMVEKFQGPSACVIDERITLTDMPSSALTSKHSTNTTKYPPVGYSFLSLPRLSERIATLSSLSGLAAVEKANGFATESSERSCRKFPSISRHTPFAAYPLAHAIAERKRDRGSKDLMKKEKRVSFWRANAPH
uniref:Uncharacterized protein n=1 Tax=Paramoeba aestuarina TaxID=180227 RepID=A0A7S4KJF0_9EUKA